MTAKHSPATPLPWKYRVTAVGGAFAGPAEISKHRSAGCGQDAAYLTHAGNAYPRLVETLREIADGRDLEMSEARALMRELGELP